MCVISECSRPLSETGYFSRDNKYYCPADYHVKFGERCAHCRDYVEGDIVQCMGGTFHQRCFACTRCRRPFAKDEKVTVNDGNGTDRLYLCTKCVALAQPIRLDTTMMSDGTTTTGAPVSPPMASPTGKLSGVLEI
jgi:actin-binding LIM protein